MKNSNILISVIVPVYNAAEYLPNCIKSILAQTYRNLEIILINDGSTDESGSICDEYAQKDKRITVIHKKNGGVSTARNTGLDRATGQYIGFVDADDTVMPDMYEKLFDTINKHSKHIAVCGHIRFHVEGPVEKREQREIPESLTVQESLEYLLSNRYFEGFLWNKLFDVGLVSGENKLRFDTDLNNCGDLLFVNQCFLRSNGVSYIPKALYNYRLNNEGLTRAYTPKRRTELLAWKRIYKANNRQSSKIKDLVYFRYFEAVVNLYRMAVLSKESERAKYYKKTAIKCLSKCLPIKTVSKKDKLRCIIILLFPKTSTGIWRWLKKRYNIIWH